MTVGAERGEIAEVGSPVEIPPAPVDHRHPWRWTTLSLALATLLLALGDGPAMAEWADDLPPGPAVSLLQPPVSAWAGFTSRWHLDMPAKWLRSQWMAARKARFGNEQPGEAGASDAP